MSRKYPVRPYDKPFPTCPATSDGIHRDSRKCRQCMHHHCGRCKMCPRCRAKTTPHPCQKFGPE